MYRATNVSFVQSNCAALLTIGMSFFFCGQSTFALQNTDKIDEEKKARSISGFVELKSVPKELEGKEFDAIKYYDPWTPSGGWLLLEMLNRGGLQIAEVELFGFETMAEKVPFYVNLKDKTTLMRFTDALKPFAMRRVYARADFAYKKGHTMAGFQVPGGIFTCYQRCFGVIKLTFKAGGLKQSMTIGVNSIFKCGSSDQQNRDQFQSLLLANLLDDILESRLKKRLNRKRFAHLSGTELREAERYEAEIEYEEENKKMKKLYTGCIYNKTKNSKAPYWIAWKKFRNDYETDLSKKWDLQGDSVFYRDLADWHWNSTPLRKGDYLEGIEYYGFKHDTNSKPHHFTLRDKKTIEGVKKKSGMVFNGVRPGICDTAPPEIAKATRDPKLGSVGVIKFLYRGPEKTKSKNKFFLVGVGEHGFYLNRWNGTIRQTFFNPILAKFLDKALKEKTGQGLTSTHLENLKGIMRDREE